MKKTKYGIFPIIGIIAGVIVIILGLGLIDSGDTASYASFGGDFYSYSYKATRYAANNLSVIINALAYLIIAFGLFDIAYFGCKLMDNKTVPVPRFIYSEECNSYKSENLDSDKANIESGTAHIEQME